MASWFTVNRTIGTGGSWWALSVSAWGEDDMREDDVAVTQGGLGIKLQSKSSKIKSKTKATKAKPKQQVQSKKLTNTKTFESIQFSFSPTAENIITNKK